MEVKYERMKKVGVELIEREQDFEREVLGILWKASNA